MSPGAEGAKVHVIHSRGVHRTILACACGLNVPLQPRRLRMPPAAVGCKRRLASHCGLSVGNLKEEPAMAFNILRSVSSPRRPLFDG